MELRNKKINFLGDSITAGAGASQEERFTDLIEKNYGAVCRNYGVCGSRFGRRDDDTPETNRSQCTFVMRAEEMDPDADIVFVFGGTNDHGGYIPLGNFYSRDDRTFYGACHVLMRGLIEKYPDSLIAFATPLHRTFEDSAYKEFDFQGRHPLKNYVDIIREVAEWYSLPVLDLYKNSGLQPEVPVIKELYIPDGLHPNDAGHRILADKIAKFLKSL